MNPASASPLLIAVMPCSRTPKQMFRPEKSAGVTLVELVTSVLVLATRSALPPTRLGTSAAAFCMTTFPCQRERSGIVRIRLQHLPAVALVTLHRVVGERDAGVAVDGDVVVVVQHHQVPESEVARERRRLVRDAFHHAAVAGDGEHPV